VNENIALLYGFSFFDQFMIVIAVWVPYLATARPVATCTAAMRVWWARTSPPPTWAGAR
jgi:hypothetical protein